MDPRRRKDVANVLTKMLEARAGGGGTDRNKKLQEWEREGRVGGEFGEFKYTTQGGEEVVIEEGVHELGHRVWDTCTEVCKMLEKNGEKLVKGKKVVEVGAGCGLVSIVASKLGAECVTATDLPTVTPHTLRNTNKYKNIKVEDLRWGDHPAPTSPPDLVVGSDVTITPHAVPDLVRTLHTLSPPLAIIAGPSHREGWRTFTTTAAEHFVVTPVPPSDLDPAYTSPRVGIVYLTRKEE